MPAGINQAALQAFADLRRSDFKPVSFSVPLTLPDGATTTVHIAVFPRKLTALRVVVFPEAERLLNWCQRAQVPYAMTGGFFRRDTRQPLGEVWMHGMRLESFPFGAQWAKKRGALHSHRGELHIAALGDLPDEPVGDLMTAGPTLIRDGRVIVHPSAEFEGIPETWRAELDDNWTQWRAARTAIGYDERRIWSVVSDGPLTDPTFRKQVGADNAPSDGLYLWEMAEILKALGATDALNMDGGGGATLIFDQELVNEPLAGKHDAGYQPGESLREGRAIHTALAFLPR